MIGGFRINQPLLEQDIDSFNTALYNEYAKLKQKN